MPKATHYYKEIRLQQLRSFCQVARLRSFAAAAAATGFSTPTVWQQVDALERDLEVTLVQRRGRGVELTEDGRLLWQLVLEPVTALESLKTVFRSRRGEQAPRLTVATSPGLVDSELVPIVREFMRRLPDVRLRVLSLPATSVQKLVEEGDADFGLVSRPEDSGPMPPLVCEQLCSLDFVLATPSRHPLAQRRRLRPVNLAGQPLIAGNPETLERLRVDQVLRAAGVLDRIRVVLETASTTVAWAYVRAGIGVTLRPLSATLLRQPLPGLQLRSVSSSFGSAQLAVLWRLGRYDTSAATEFRAAARATHGNA